MTDLLAFLASLRYVEPAGTPVAGKQVFADRGCAACHGNSAEGTQSGPRLKADKNPLPPCRSLLLCGVTALE